jgi:hypothetical protein
LVQCGLVTLLQCRSNQARKGLSAQSPLRRGLAQTETSFVELLPTPSTLVAAFPQLVLSTLPENNASSASVAIHMIVRAACLQIVKFNVGPFCDVQNRVWRADKTARKRSFGASDALKTQFKAVAFLKLIDWLYSAVFCLL